MPRNLLVKASNSTPHIYTMRIFPGACIKILLCNRISLKLILYHKDRLIPSLCRIISLSVPFFSSFSLSIIQFLVPPVLYSSHSSTSCEWTHILSCHDSATLPPTLSSHNKWMYIVVHRCILIRLPEST